MAAKTRTVLLCLAAFCLPALANVPRASLLSEKPHQGVAGFVLASHWGAAAAKALSAPGLCGCLYDSGRRSRSTGKERDAETGLDYFGARYMSAAQGRFTSPDEPLFDQEESDPQSWNLYGYVRNNPLRFTDPTGRACVAGPKGDYDDDRGGQSCADVAKDNANLKPSSTTTAQGGNALVAFGLNTAFALDSTASSYFGFLTSAMGVSPSYMQPIPTNREFTGQFATASVFVATNVGPGGVRRIWTSTSKLSGVKNAFTHWMKHKKDFPNLQNAKQYVEAAQDFVANPPTGTLSKVRANGDVLLYNPGTNTFAVKAADGTPRTMFKPTLGSTYFHAQ